MSGREIVAATWERAIARILDGTRPEGVGFLVADGYVLTCHHVVAAVAGLPDEEPLPEGHRVHLDFPLSATPGQYEAEVRFSSPIAENGRGDFAVLRLLAEPPADAPPLRLSDDVDLAGHHWLAFGFPVTRGSAKDEGVWSKGEILGREGTGWWQLSTDRDAAFVLAQGFSGGPVWDVELRAVVGIIVSVEGSAALRTGYASTIESLERNWSPIRTVLLADNPYRELSSFTEDDAAVFFGRDQEALRLFELVDVESMAIVAVLGASGVGKSSLVNAGLLTRLRGTGRYLPMHIPHGLRYNAEELLAWALTSVDETVDRSDDAAWHEKWRALAERVAEPGGLTTSVDRILTGRSRGTRLLLVVDQFEGLLAESPEVAIQLDALLGMLTARRADGSRPAQAVVIARTDTMNYLKDLRHLAEAWHAVELVVPPMTREQLRAAAEQPLLKRGGVRFADGLLERILQDTSVGAAALPLLEFTLTRLWQDQRRGELTAAAYQSLGGVGGALAGAAEKALWSWADTADQATLERIFIQLVRPGDRVDAGEPVPDTRRVVDAKQFNAREQALIQRLAATRLIVVIRQRTGTQTVELAHETLLREWPRLAAWVQANRGFRLWQEHVRDAERAWQLAGRPRERLLSPLQTKDALDWVRRRGDEVTADESTYIEASRAAHTRRRRQWYGLFGTVAVLCALGVAAALIAIQQHNGNLQAQQASLSRQMVAQATSLDGTQSNIAKQLRIAAYNASPTSQAFDALATGLGLPGKIDVPGVQHVAISNTLLLIIANGQVRLWSTSTHQFVSTLLTAGVTAAAFSPDGATVAVANATGEIELWRVTQPSSPTREEVLRAARGPVAALAYNPRGHTLAAGGFDHVIRIWDTTPGAGGSPLTAMTAGSGTVSALSYSSNGQQLADSDWDGTVSLWDVSSPASPTRLAQLNVGLPMRGVALDPASRLLAAVGDDEQVHLWSTANPSSLAAYKPFGSGTHYDTAVVFTPDGTTLLTAGADNLTQVGVWDVTIPGSPTQLPSLADGSGNTDLAFSPDGTVLASLDQPPGSSRTTDNAVKLWEVSDLRMPAADAPLNISTFGFDNFAFNSDGTLLTGAGFDGVRLWNVSDPEHPRLLWTKLGVGQSASLAGHTLAVGSSSSISLWNVADLTRPSSEGSIRLTGAGAYPDSVDVAFSPSGRQLLARDSESTAAWLIDTADPADPSVLASFDNAPSGQDSFSADGSILAIGSLGATPGSGYTAGLWSLADPRHPAPLKALTSRIGNASALEFAPSGNVLAAGETDGTITFWQVTAAGSATRLAAISAGGGAGITGLRYSADGQSLISVDEAGNVHIWNVSNATGPVAIGSYAQPNPDRLQLNSATIAVGPAHGSDGDRLIVTSGDLISPEIWTSGADQLISRLCRTIGDTMSTAEWAKYAPTAGDTNPCSDAG